MKAGQRQKQKLQDTTEQNKTKEQQRSQVLSLSVTCTSGYQQSIQSNRKGKYYASFSFRFQTRPSFEYSEFLSEGEQFRMDQFFDDEIIFERKVDKRDVVFRPGCLSSKFIKHASEAIYKFCQQPIELNFPALLQQISIPEIPIFDKAEEISEKYTLNQALEDLFYRKQHKYLIYSFDWSICHLSFVCCLLIYWMQIDIQQPFEENQWFNKNKQEYIEQEKIKLKQNVCHVALNYAQQRSQQINLNQPVLLVLYGFLNFMKRQPCLNIVQISVTQDRLINDIKLFRRIKRKQRQFQSTVNKCIFQSQLRKYQFQHKLTTSAQKTYTLINLISSHNFVSCPLLKYYQLDQHKNCRRVYQFKKDYFCLWVLNIILNECQMKTINAIHNSSMYVLVFLVILKRMKKQGNLEGLSYLVPILTNVKIYIPKLWDYVKKRRPQIQKRLHQYEKKLLKKQYKVDDLSQRAILWKQTVFQMASRMQKFLSPKQYIDLEEHRKFYNQFLIHFLQFRAHVQRQYKREIEQYNQDKQIGSSFNMYLIDTYVPRLYEDKDHEAEWNKFIRRAQRIDKNINTSLYSNMMNYCFVGSTQIFQRMDI